MIVLDTYYIPPNTCIPVVELVLNCIVGLLCVKCTSKSSRMSSLLSIYLLCQDFSQSDEIYGSVMVKVPNKLVAGNDPKPQTQT